MWGMPAIASFPPPSGAAQAGMELPKTVIRVGEQSLWSAYSYADNAAVAGVDRRTFTTPLGQVGQGFAVPMSIAETNMKESGRIASGQAYDVYGVALQPYLYDNTSIPGNTMRNVLNNMVLAWDFLQSLIEIAPTQLIGGGGGIFGMTADTGDDNSARAVLNNGNGQIWVYQRFPVMLSANSTFSMVQRWGVGASAIDGGISNTALILKNMFLGQYKIALASG